MRYGWLTKLPANGPSFLQMQRKENGEPDPAAENRKLQLDEEGVKNVLRRLNRPHSAPPRQRGGGELRGWAGPQGRLEVAAFKSLLPQEQWPLAGQDGGHRWPKAK